MTFAQIVAYKRDIKRRRMKYRTTKQPPLSRTEEVRRLIDTQMEALIQYLKPEENQMIDIPSCSKSIDRKKSFSPEKIDSSSKRTYHRSDSSHHKKHKRSKSRSRSPKKISKRKHEHEIVIPSCSKSSQRRKSLSPENCSSSSSRRSYNRSDSRDRRTDRRKRSRSLDRRDQISKREHKKSKHKKRERSRSRSPNRNHDYKKKYKK